MGSLAVLTGLNTLVLLAPPQTISDLLTLMPLPTYGRNVLLVGTVINAMLSLGFERWGASVLAVVAGRMAKTGHQWWGRRRREGKVYKAVEGGMAEA